MTRSLRAQLRVFSVKLFAYQAYKQQYSSAPHDMLHRTHQTYRSLSNTISTTACALHCYNLHKTAKAQQLYPYGAGGSSSGDHAALKAVKTASKAADKHSEAIAADFLAGRTTDSSTFIESYMSERQRYHRLASKMECMKRVMDF
jgi:Modifier of rudimentary (Mod(r)) protein